MSFKIVYEDRTMESKTSVADVAERMVWLEASTVDGEPIVWLEDRVAVVGQPMVWLRELVADVTLPMVWPGDPIVDAEPMVWLEDMVADVGKPTVWLKELVADVTLSMVWFQGATSRLQFSARP